MYRVGGWEDLYFLIALYHCYTYVDGQTVLCCLLSFLINQYLPWQPSGFNQSQHSAVLYYVSPAISSAAALRPSAHPHNQLTWFSCIKPHLQCNTLT